MRKTHERELRTDTPHAVRRLVHQLERERQVLTYKTMIIPIEILILACVFIRMCIWSIS